MNLVVLCLWVPVLPAESAHAPGAVATEVAAASQAAIGQLDAGGNAIDAAVTAALVAGVCHPSSSGVGGGGFALVWEAVTQRVKVFDFREVAPAALDGQAFENRPFDAAERGRLVGVPGEVAGLFALHSQYGQKSWAEVVAPAVMSARQGFVLTPHLARVLDVAGRSIRRDLSLRTLFSEHGLPKAAGTVVSNRALAATLERLQHEGPASFYHGQIATGIVHTARRFGGWLTLEDLASYRVVEREALQLSWEGYQVYTMPPPSAGGILLAQALKVFSVRELGALASQSGGYYHLLAESVRASLADRFRYVGDPAPWPTPTELLLDDERMRQRRRTIDLNHTRLVPQIVTEEHGTHHIVTSDAEGNVVSLTTTVNRIFGAQLTTAQGVVLNDELDDFTATKHLQALGLTQNPNQARPGARPVSSMTPTLVTRGTEAVMAVGGSGGMAIAANVLQVLLGRLAFDLSPEDAVTAPRFFVPINGASIQVAADAPESLVLDLEGRGEHVERASRDGSAVQLLVRDASQTRPAADPRKYGLALTQ